MRAICFIILTSLFLFTSQAQENADSTESDVAMSEWSNLSIDSDALFSEDEGSTDSIGAVAFPVADPIRIQGNIIARFRYHVHGTSPLQTPVFPGARASLGLQYTDKNSEAGIILNFDSDMFHDLNNKNLVRRLLRETYFKLFFSTLTVEVGYLRPVLKTNDPDRVIDVLSIYDQNAALDADPLIQRLPSLAIHTTFFLSTWGLLELYYLPVFMGDIMPDRDSAWEYTRQKDFFRLAGQVAQPSDQFAFEQGQLASYFRVNLSRVDLGLIYYFGYQKQPSLRYKDGNSKLGVELFYDRSHVFAFEANFGLGPVILDAQISYYLTNQSRDSLRFSAQMNANIPVSNLALLLHMNGMYMIGEAETILNAKQKDIPAPNDYYDRIIVGLTLRDSYLGYVISPEVGVDFEVFSYDIRIRAAVRMLLHINASVTIRSVIFESLNKRSDGIFSQYTDNDFLELLFSYTF